MTKNERLALALRKKVRRTVARRYKAAYAFYEVFKARYFKGLQNLMQSLPDMQYQLEEAVELRAAIAEPCKKQQSRQALKALRRFSGCIEQLQNWAEHMCKQISKAYEDYRNSLEGFPLFPTVEGFMKDLIAIERDFVKWTFKDGILHVRTEPLTLKHPSESFAVRFNEFDINLRLDQIAQDVDSPYTISAPDPIPLPRSREDFIHPHVSGSVLCEGDAREALKQTLGRGLLYDFFIVINQTLATYNPDSPHLKLAYWTEGDHEDGMEEEEQDPDAPTCGSCGYRGHQDDFRTCEDCGETYCGEHVRWCEDGSRDICENCLDRRLQADRACCNEIGGNDCLIRTNEECSDCGDSYSDGEYDTCEYDEAIVLCRTCAERRINTPAIRSDCAPCEEIGLEGCLLVRYGLPLLDQVVPASCQDCDYATYHGCSIILGDEDPPEEENEQESTEKEAQEDDRETGNQPDSTKLQIFE